MSDPAVTFHLVIMNPNTSHQVTAMLDKHARRVARPRTNVVTLRPDNGPAAVERWGDAYRSAVGMLDRVMSYDGPIDALVLAGFGDVGLEALREAVDAPVVDITQAGAAGALAVGGRYGIVTTVATMVEPIRSNLSDSGLLGRCVGIQPIEMGILDSAAREAVLPRLLDATKQLVDGGCEAVCLGSAVFSVYANALRAEVSVPVIDPLATAINLIETAWARGARPAGEA